MMAKTPVLWFAVGWLGWLSGIGVAWPANAESQPFYENKAGLTDLKKEAARGVAEAQHNLGVHYALGIGIKEPDFKQAADWFKKAAVQGHAAAQFRLASLYDSGNLGGKEDAAQAVYWFGCAASNGVAEAQYKMGTICLINNQMAAALTWMHKAAEGATPVPDAQWQLAKIYQAMKNNVQYYRWTFIAAAYSQPDACLQVSRWGKYPVPQAEKQNWEDGKRQADEYLNNASAKVRATLSTR